MYAVSVGTPDSVKHKARFFRKRALCLMVVSSIMSSNLGLAQFKPRHMHLISLEVLFVLFRTKEACVGTINYRYRRRQWIWENDGGQEHPGIF